MVQHEGVSNKAEMEDFKKYLEKNDVMRILKRVLIELYATEPQPEDPLEFFRTSLCESLENAKQSVTMEDRIKVLEEQNKLLKAQNVELVKLQAIFQKFSCDETTGNNEHHRFASKLAHGIEICAADGIRGSSHAKEGMEWDSYDPAIEKNLDAEVTKVNGIDNVLIDSINENPNVISCDMDNAPKSDKNAVLERCQMLAIVESTAMVSATAVEIAVEPEKTSILCEQNTFGGHRRMATDEINTNENIIVATEATTSSGSPIAESEIGSILIAEQQHLPKNSSNTFTVQDDSELPSEAGASMQFTPIEEELIGDVHHLEPIVDDFAAEHSIEGSISYVHQLPTITKECTATITLISENVSPNMQNSSQTFVKPVSEPLPTIVEESQLQSPMVVIEPDLALKFVTGYQTQCARDSTEPTGELVSMNHPPIILDEYATTFSVNADHSIDETNGDVLQLTNVEKPDLILTLAHSKRIPSESTEQLISDVHQLPAITKVFLAALTPMAADDSKIATKLTQPIKMSSSNVYPLQTSVEETTAPFTFITGNHSQNRFEKIEGRDLTDMATFLVTSEPSSDSASLGPEYTFLPNSQTTLISCLEDAKSQITAHTHSEIADPEMATKEMEIGFIPDEMPDTAAIVNGSEFQSQVATNTSIDTLSIDTDVAYEMTIHDENSLQNKFSENFLPVSTIPLDDDSQSNVSDPNTVSTQKREPDEEAPSTNLVEESTIEIDVTHPEMQSTERNSLELIPSQSAPLANTALSTETIALKESETSSTASEREASVPLNQFSSEVGEEEDYLLPSTIFRNNLEEAGNKTGKKLCKEKMDIELEIRQIERRLKELRSVHDQITLKYNEEKKGIAKSHKKRLVNRQK